MNLQGIRELQESYLEIYESSLIQSDPNRLARKLGSRLKREVKRTSDQDAATSKTNRYLDVADTLRRRAPRGADTAKNFRRGYAMGEELDMILDYLIDEGYADSLGSAEIIFENMSDEWLDDILEAFVDPESNETPSGRRPIDTVAEHPRKKTREKAMKGFVKQMNRNYTGGRFKAKTKDPTKY